jgi:hypothetical protein
LEIFSDAELPGSLWQQDPIEVAAQGVEKLRQVVATEPFNQAKP